MARRKGNPISVRLDLNRSSDSSWLSKMYGVTLSNARQAAALAAHKPCSSTEFVQSVWRESFILQKRIVFFLFSVVGNSLLCHQHNKEFLVVLSLLLFTSIPLFHFVCRLGMNPFFKKCLYYAILFCFFILLGSLREIWSYLLIFSMGVANGGSAPGHFEPSLPPINENEEFRGPESRKIPGGEAGASSSQGSEILNGVPVQWSDTVSYASPRFLGSSVYLPGELMENPLIVEKLSAFNPLLVNVRYDFYNGVHDATLVRPLQLELDQTPQELLPEKLEAMFWRERGRFYKNGEELPFYCVHSQSFYKA